MKKDNVTLEALIQMARPIDPSVYTKELFLQNITPELEEQFSKSYSEEFEKLIEEKNGVYFIINISKRKIFKEEPMIRLSTCGPERLPTISLDL